MLFHRRRSFYPLAIALLTLALGLLMLYTLGSSTSPTGRKSVGTQVSPTPAVTDADYRTNSHAVIAPFLASYGAATNDAIKLAAVEDALAALMPITVPASYKDVHLGLAVSLSLMRDGLRGEDGSLDAGYAKLTKIVATEPWLAP
ncbi:MAG: hypothetical protein WCO25_00935 [Candidatus Uhrbacteria bacterium]